MARSLSRFFCRIESLVDEDWSEARMEDEFQERLKRHGYLALFSHEGELRRLEVQQMTTRCLATLNRLGVASV